MANYTIQKGQSLGQIAKDNMTSIAEIMKLNPQIKDANLIYTGQQIALPSFNTKTTITTPTFTPSQTAKSTPVTLGQQTPLLTLNKQPASVIATSTPGQIDLNSVAQANIPVLPKDTTFIGPMKPENVLTSPEIPTDYYTTQQNPEITAIDKILNQKNLLQQEVSELEDKIMNRSKTRDEALTTAGVYDDIKALNELRTQQEALEEEARLYLVGKAGTKAGLASLTNLESRQALLQENQLTNRINTNIAIIDEKQKADNQAIDILYAKKLGLLESVSKNYSDLLTEQEKQALELQKFQQQILMENMKFDNNLILERAKTAMKNAADKGITLSDTDMQKILSGDATAINQIYGRTSDISQSASDQKVDLINSLLGNTVGLSANVGATALGRTRLGAMVGMGVMGGALGAVAGSVVPGLGTLAGAGAGFVGGALGSGANMSGSINLFQADLKQLVSQETLDYLVAMKAKGATFGALSEKELGMLQDASNSLGIKQFRDKDGNVTNIYSNLAEKDFKQKLEDIRFAVQKVSVADMLSSQGKDTAFLKNISKESFNSLYNSLKSTTYSSETGLTPYDEIIKNNTDKTSLNIPQRNNNPGNVKTTGTATGGVAAQFALKNPDGTPKTDNFGHLIFANAEDGVKGLVADLTAKINGQSSHMPANPTLAQLGRVYAEDGSWANGVSRILGVPTGTATSIIPLDKLVLAIAKQEGYFA